MAKEMLWTGGFAVWMFLCGYITGVPFKSDQRLLDEAKSVLKECQKDLPQSQVCELSAKVKEGKE